MARAHLFPWLLILLTLSIGLCSEEQDDELIEPEVEASSLETHRVGTHASGTQYNYVKAEAEQQQQAQRAGTPNIFAGLQHLLGGDAKGHIKMANSDSGEMKDLADDLLKLLRGGNTPRKSTGPAGPKSPGRPPPTPPPRLRVELGAPISDVFTSIRQSIADATPHPADETPHPADEGRRDARAADGGGG
eukprot:CAMPEP_0183342636 /NCGR_PEP_ID=MMETSP0164_2-20130417/8720_1 /TAXON_ID=221442 /ORGANISM="Coccolithus pelagicus ssp braarudi, Strain PLY182g" /LENGTH=189 /DNA_ID=CAMNT_0025513291 /DNA_START=36 /DNA_END=602 /DNA_ORIENTATION=-